MDMIRITFFLGVVRQIAASFLTIPFLILSVLLPVAYQNENGNFFQHGNIVHSMPRRLVHAHPKHR
jgi:hypothetical protein